MDREKVIEGLRDIDMFIAGRLGHEKAKNFLRTIDETIALLKEQEEQEQRWLRSIADNQIANAPNDSPMSLDEQLESEYKSGIYDGLQMAFEILTEGR